MEPLLGEIDLFPFGFVPANWHACDGALLNISQNTALYSLLGTQFGGNGTTTFGLPDLRNASPIPGLTYCIATMGIYPNRPF